MTHTIDRTARTLVAEAVLPGHPDKLADQIADSIVDIALERDERAIVQVEVAVDGDTCFVDGRCSTAGGPLDRWLVDATIRAVYLRAGFGDVFAGLGDGRDYQCPRGSDVKLHMNAVIDEADPSERAEREYTDDQAIHIGYAVAEPSCRYLPLEQHLVLVLRDRLLELCVLERGLGAGPDGKLLITLVPDRASGMASRYRVADVIVSVQHLAGASVVAIERAVRDVFVAELLAQATVMPHLLFVPDDLSIRVNLSGVFIAGGPMNDNGQTGRKLVFDAYGPRVPIGGGAFSGKDPWRLDRAAAFRARQIALAIVDTGFVEEAQVTFAWAPRDRRPSHVEIVADGRVLDTVTAGRWLRKFDPSLAATWAELELSKVNYESCARAGHFGRDVPWEAGFLCGSAQLAFSTQDQSTRLLRELACGSFC